MGMQTSRVVHASELETLALRGDLYLRMERKLESRAGREVSYVVDERLVRLACCYRSSRQAYLVTLTATDDPSKPLPSDGAIYNMMREGKPPPRWWSRQTMQTYRR